MDTLFHYYRKGAEPFRSLTVLTESEAIRIMQTMYVEKSVIWERFKDPGEYLRERKLTEAWLHREFILKGGQPVDPFPIYMVLGKSRWIQRMADPATLATTAEIKVPLSIFKETEISFTYPDSMISHWFGEEKPPEYYQPEYHGRVFTLTEIREIVRQKGFPEEEWKTNLPAHLAHYIEAQVWNRRLLAEFMRDTDWNYQ